MAVEAGEVGTTMTDTPDGPVLSTTGTSNAGTDTGIDADSFTPTHTQHEKFLLNYFDAQYEVLTTFQPEVVGHMDLCLLWTPGVSLREIGAVWEKVERNVRYIIGYGGMVEANSASLRKGWETSYPGRDIVRVSNQVYLYHLDLAWRNRISMLTPAHPLTRWKDLSLGRLARYPSCRIKLHSYAGLLDERGG